MAPRRRSEDECGKERRELQRHGEPRRAALFSQPREQPCFEGKIRRAGARRSVTGRAEKGVEFLVRIRG